jgi:quercetin dioxygenase-like cupin family protein
MAVTGVRMMGESFDDIRRVVTGFDERGAPAVIADGPPPIVHPSDRYPGVDIGLLWIADAHPVLPGPEETVLEQPAHQPDVVFQVVTFAPGAELPHHRTRAIDLVTVLDGEIVLVQGDHEVTLRPHDVVVQRGTAHAWVNRTDRPCRVSFVNLKAIVPEKPSA